MTYISSYKRGHRSVIEPVPFTRSLAYSSCRIKAVREAIAGAPNRVALKVALTLSRESIERDRCNEHLAPGELDRRERNLNLAVQAFKCGFPMTCQMYLRRLWQ